jgi:hypothetical protein
LLDKQPGGRQRTPQVPRHPRSLRESKSESRSGNADSTTLQTARDEGSDAKGSRAKFENGFVDGPGGRGDASDIQAHAKRDASPGQAPNLVEEDLPPGRTVIGMMSDAGTLTEIESRFSHQTLPSPPGAEGPLGWLGC